MKVETDYAQINGMVRERNRLFKALQEIQQIAENSSDSQSKIIAAKCKDTLKSRPNKLSTKTKRFIEDYEHRRELILSGEFMEQFQV